MCCQSFARVDALQSCASSFKNLSMGSVPWSRSNERDSHSRGYCCCFSYQPWILPSKATTTRRSHRHQPTRPEALGDPLTHLPLQPPKPGHHHKPNSMGSDCATPQPGRPGAALQGKQAMARPGITSPVVTAVLVGALLLMQTFLYRNCSSTGGLWNSRTSVWRLPRT